MIVLIVLLYLLVAWAIYRHEALDTSWVLTVQISNKYLGWTPGFFIAHSWVLHPRHSPRSDACCMGRSWINWGGFTLVNPFAALASKSWHPAFLCRRYEAFGLGASQNLIFEQCIKELAYTGILHLLRRKRYYTEIGRDFTESFM